MGFLNGFWFECEGCCFQQKPLILKYSGCELELSEWKLVSPKEKEIDMSVIETANIAMAIKNKEHITNLELSIALSALPPAKAFEEMHTLVALFKEIQG